MLPSISSPRSERSTDSGSTQMMTTTTSLWYIWMGGDDNEEGTPVIIDQTELALDSNAAPCGKTERFPIEGLG